MPTSWRFRLLLGLAAVAAVIGMVFVVRAVGDQRRTVAETPAPSPSATEPAQPEPFRVKILSTKGEVTDSTNMFGRPASRNGRVVQQASQQAGKALERYLNSAFVDPKTRFTGRPLKALLTPNARRALDQRDRRALGAGAAEIEGGKTVSANARTVVLYTGKRAYAVNVRYSAKMNIIQGDEPQRMTQSGTMVFKKVRGAGWAADFVDVRLALPPKPKPQPTPGATP